MFQLQQEFFTNESRFPPSEVERRFDAQVAKMQNLLPRDYGGTESMNPFAPEMKYSWKQAIR